MPMVFQACADLHPFSRYIRGVIRAEFSQLDAAPEMHRDLFQKSNPAVCLQSLERFIEQKNEPLAASEAMLDERWRIVSQHDAGIADSLTEAISRDEDGKKVGSQLFIHVVIRKLLVRLKVR